MARLHRPRSTSCHHEPLLRDFQGQENDHQRQDEEISSAKNDKRPEDGLEEQDSHIYPRRLASHSREVHDEKIKPEQQDHHISSLYSADTKSILPCYLNSVRLPKVKVRCSVVFISDWVVPPPTIQPYR